jgi:DNA-binding transcriptional regulator YdaS (Cro superfamily)
METVMTSMIPAASISQPQPVTTGSLPKVSVSPSLLQRASSIPFNQPASTPPDSLYANVVVNGQTVARIYNSGTTQIPSSTINAQIQNLPSLNDNTLTGPDAAQQRAAAIARALGGTAVRAQTAQTQQQWQESDYANAAQQIVQSHSTTGATLLQAQLLGQSG